MSAEFGNYEKKEIRFRSNALFPIKYGLLV